MGDRRIGVPFLAEAKMFLLKASIPALFTYPAYYSGKGGVKRTEFETDHWYARIISTEQPSRVIN
jgi:hypothetical protein